MTEQFVRNALDKGEEGALWLKKIPDLINEFEQKWNIRVGPAFNLSYNYVAPAQLQNGTKAVIKIGFPTDKEFKTEIDALEVYNGEGIVSLFEADGEKAVILIEQLEPGIPLSTLEYDEDATRILASVMKKLRKVPPPDHRFPHIADWAKGIERYRKTFTGTDGPLPSKLVNRAENLFEELISSISSTVLAHGDLHHANVLSATREPWLAIDPKGVIAEPAYETAAMLRNPVSSILKKANLKAVLSKRITLLSQELEIEPIRILKWGIAQTVLSAVWSVEDHGKGWEDAIVIAEILNEIAL